MQRATPSIKKSVLTDKPTETNQNSFASDLKSTYHRCRNKQQETEAVSLIYVRGVHTLKQKIGSD